MESSATAVAYRALCSASVPSTASISNDDRFPRTWPRTVFCSSASTRFNFRAIATTTGDSSSLRSSKRAGSTTGTTGLAFAFFSAFGAAAFAAAFSSFTISDAIVAFAATSAVLPARNFAKISSTATTSFFGAGATTTTSAAGISTSASISISGMSTERRPRPNSDTTFV